VPMNLYEEVFVLAGKIGKETDMHSLVIDTEEQHPACLGMAREIAARMGARYLAVEDLGALDIARAVTEPGAGSPPG